MSRCRCTWKSGSQGLSGSLNLPSKISWEELQNEQDLQEAGQRAGTTLQSAWSFDQSKQCRYLVKGEPAASASKTNRIVGCSRALLRSLLAKKEFAKFAHSGASINSVLVFFLRGGCGKGTFDKLLHCFDWSKIHFLVQCRLSSLAGFFSSQICASYPFSSWILAGRISWLVLVARMFYYGEYPVVF